MICKIYVGRYFILLPDDNNVAMKFNMASILKPNRYKSIQIQKNKYRGDNKYKYASRMKPREMGMDWRDTSRS